MLKLLGVPLSIWPLILFLGDVVMFGISVLISYFVTRMTFEIPWFLLNVFLVPISILGLIYILVLYIANLYDHYLDFRRLENLSTMILSSLIATLLAVILFTLPARHVLARGFVEWQGVVFVWLLVGWRFIFSTIALPLRLQRRVLIIGAGKAGREIHTVITKRTNSGLAVAGFLDDNPHQMGAIIDGTPVLGNTSQLGEMIASHRIGMLVMAITHRNPTGLLNNLVRFSFMGVKLIDMPSL